MTMITKGECINCGGNKRICPFSMSKWRGRKDSITGLSIVNVEPIDKNSCNLWSVFID